MHAGTAWYLTAHCHLRQNIRHFRLDRITGLEVLSKEFVRPSDFSRKPAEVEQRTTTVRALFDPDTAPWVLPHRNGRYCLRPVGHASVLSDK